MDQMEVCNSWEEFEDNSKLLDEQLEKLRLKKEKVAVLNSESKSQSSSSSTSGSSEVQRKMKVLKRNVAPVPVSSTQGEGVTTKREEEESCSTNDGVVVQEESLRTQYVPPEPRISILSRPKKASDLPGGADGKSKNQPVKTLEQREQEYAEARRRIFGDSTTTVES